MVGPPAKPVDGWHRVERASLLLEINLMPTDALDSTLIIVKHAEHTLARHDGGVLL